MKCAARIDAGVCGFTTTVRADAPDGQMVRLAIQTDCDKISALAQMLEGREIDGYAEIGAGFDGVILSAARSALSGCCAACAVPVGLFKASQVAAQVALPKAIAITIETE
jgi:hypothetical protein